MKITIELRYGLYHSESVAKGDIQKNIDAIERAIAGRETVIDDMLLEDTKSILVGIQEKLPGI
jgi:hypothetical protein